MPTYPLPTLAPTISSTGISAPSYNDILQSLIASFKAIYGSDIVVSADSQDGQLLAVFAKAINDSNQATIAAYNSFSPFYAQGTGLSSLVKLSAISRNVATNSTAVGLVTGISGTTIRDGVVRDVSGNLWSLPAIVTIPLSGQISVTVTAQTPGAINAQVGDIATVYNPQYGWSTFTNTSAATAGSPVESDAALRRRQMVSSALPALTVLAAISAAIGNVPGVTRWLIYENATNVTDANGLPPHSFSAVVEGGTTAAIATAIQARKPPGIQTYGSTAVQVLDALALPATINYNPLAYVPVYVIVTIQSLAGYTAAIGTEIVTAVSDFLNNLSIGENAYYSQVNAAGSLITLADGQTFFIQSLYIGTVGFTGRIDNGTPGVAGNILTVSAMNAGSAPLAVGQTIFGVGVTPVTITALGTGTGGVGTYVISGGTQNVASETMLAAAGGGVANITVPYNKAAQCPVGNITLVVH